MSYVEIGDELGYHRATILNWIGAGPINLTTPTRTNKRSCRLTRFRVRRAPITATANALGLGDADAALGR